MREQRRINTQEIKDACERFLEKRGEKQPTFRDMVNKAAKRGKRRSAAQNKIEQAAQELENED